MSKTEHRDQLTRHFRIVSFRELYTLRQRSSSTTFNADLRACRIQLSRRTPVIVHHINAKEVKACWRLRGDSKRQLWLRISVCINVEDNQ